MMRQSASRNQRSKGAFRLKHVLQICLLLAVCTWLLYQLKHSHDKKKAFEDKISKINTKVTSKQPDLFNFGRKGLPIVNEIDSMTENHSKDDDNEEGQEEEGEQEQDMKHEEAEDEEVKRDGDDMIDEQDQGSNHEENEQEEEFTSEEEKDGQVEEDGLFDNEEHEDSSQEAREENYKRDDASSAVTHDSHATDARGLDEEREIEDSKADNLETAANGTVDDAKNISNTTLGYAASTSNLSNVDLPMNSSHSEAKELEVEFMKLPNGSNPSPESTESTNLKELQPNTTISTLPENNLEVTAIPSVNVSDSSLVILNSSKIDDAVSTREIPRLEGTGLIQVQDQNTSLTNEASREGPVEHNEKSDASEGHESEDHPMSQTGATNQIEPGGLSQNAVKVEESETRTDVSALPVIQNEVKHANGEVAE